MDLHVRKNSTQLAMALVKSAWTNCLLNDLTPKITLDIPNYFSGIQLQYYVTFQKVDGAHLNQEDLKPWL